MNKVHRNKQKKSSWMKDRQIPQKKMLVIHETTTWRLLGIRNPSCVARIVHVVQSNLLCGSETMYC